MAPATSSRRINHRFPGGTRSGAYAGQCACPAKDKRVGCSRWLPSVSLRCAQRHPSSGKPVRYRLNRQAFRALYTIALSCMRYDKRMLTYIFKRIAKGTSKREITRCLKRYIARQVFRALLNPGAKKHECEESLKVEAAVGTPHPQGGCFKALTPSPSGSARSSAKRGSTASFRTDTRCSYPKYARAVR
mgnify:CR=1 FL=1